MEIHRMLEELEEMTVNRPRAFGPIVWGLNQDEIQMKISMVRASLPIEMKQAQNLARDADRHLEAAREESEKIREAAQAHSDSVIQAAKAEAERIVSEARLAQERLLADNEILKLAKAQADELRANADREAVALRRGAEDYSFNVLTQLEAVVGKVMHTIDRGKAELGPNSIPESAVVQPRDREKARLG